MEVLVLLRVLAEVQKREEAEALANELIRGVEAVSSVESQTIEPYWKIPELFEISLEFTPVGDARRAFDGLVRRIGGEWEIHSQDVDLPWAVWSCESGLSLDFPVINWASLETLSVESS